MKNREKIYLFFLMVTGIIFLMFTFWCLTILQDGFQLRIAVFFVIFIMAVLFIGIQFTKYLRHMDYEKEILDEKERLQKEYMLEIEKEQEALSELEKNISDYMDHIKSLLERAAVKETKEYTETILEECSKKRWKKMCNHPLLDAVLHSKAEICEKNDILLEVNSFVPENIPFSDAEIISIYHNLLNNAIEACQRMDAGEKRWITFKTGSKNGVFIINAENSRKRNEHIAGNTWKKDKAFHGLGKKIVRDIAEKYHGSCLYDKNKDSYSVIVTVNEGEI